MDTVTRKDVEIQFETLNKVMTRYGLIERELHLHFGSKINGISFRLWDGDGHEPIVGRSYLGMTKREARDELYNRWTLISDLAYHGKLKMAEGCES
jgi:hypothetical protein